jgi:hypothetical protein
MSSKMEEEKEASENPELVKAIPIFLKKSSERPVFVRESSENEKKEFEKPELVSEISENNRNEIPIFLKKTSERPVFVRESSENNKPVKHKFVRKRSRSNLKEMQEDSKCYSKKLELIKQFERVKYEKNRLFNSGKSTQVNKPNLQRVQHPFVPKQTQIKPQPCNCAKQTNTLPKKNSNYTPSRSVLKPPFKPMPVVNKPFIMNNVNNNNVEYKQHSLVDIVLENMRMPTVYLVTVGMLWRGYKKWNQDKPEKLVVEKE